jgi:hypothetical protein
MGHGRHHHKTRAKMEAVRPIVNAALASRQMSKASFDQAVAAGANPATLQTFLTSHQVTVMGSSDAQDPAVTGHQAARKLLDAAGDSKKMSKDDFNKAVALYAGPQATKDEKLAVGAKMLDFLAKRKIKVS